MTLIDEMRISKPFINVSPVDNKTDDLTDYPCFLEDEKLDF